MLVRGVIQHELGDDAEPALVCLVEQAPELAQVPVDRVDATVIGDVVPLVLQGRGVEGQQPDRGDAEVLQVVEPLGEPGEVTDAVAVAVREGTHVCLVDDRVAVPRRVRRKQRAAPCGHAPAPRPMVNTCAGTDRGSSSTKL